MRNYRDSELIKEGEKLLFIDFSGNYGFANTEHFIDFSVNYESATVEHASMTRCISPCFFVFYFIH